MGGQRTTMTGWLIAAVSMAVALWAWQSRQATRAAWAQAARETQQLAVQVADLERQLTAARQANQRWAQPTVEHADSRPHPPAPLHQVLLERNRRQHAADSAKYPGGELAQLYQVVVAPRNSPIGRPDRAADDAFMALLTKYPDSYATAMAIAERALNAGRSLHLNEVESFYQLLRTKPALADVVTDRGVEAIPTLQHLLADTFVREGRFKEAQALLDELVKAYPQGVIALPGQQPGQLDLQPVALVAERLRPKLQAAQAKTSP